MVCWEWTAGRSPQERRRLKMMVVLKEKVIQKLLDWESILTIQSLFFFLLYHWFIIKGYKSERDA